MIGAILVDIIGSRFEFARPQPQTKDFELFTEQSRFTDDTVMTCAIADGLMNVTDVNDDETVRNELVQSVLKFARKYWKAGFGQMFMQKFLLSKNPQPYNSCGNGSAMRVSAAGWLYASLEEAFHFAELTADITHNHPEGIKGAQATAAAIFLARTGQKKAAIKQYIEETFSYNLDTSAEEIRAKYRQSGHGKEICQISVPDAIIAFLLAEDFEDALRTVISFGGDTDTTGAICGGIAEAYFGIPDALQEQAFLHLPEDLAEVARRFRKKLQPTS